MMLADEVAIVTGGGRGIGRAIARRFAAEGASVVITSRTAAQLESVAKEIADAGGDAAWVAADVSREEDAETILNVAREEFGGANILVNNAGIYGPVKPIEEISVEEWDSVISTHLRGAFLLTRAALRGIVCARWRSNFEYFEHCCARSICMGRPLLDGEGGSTGINAHNSCRRREAWRSRECNSSRAGCGYRNVTGIGPEIGRAIRTRRRRNVQGVPERSFAGTSANCRRNRGSCGVLGFRSSQRNYWTGAERGRWNVFLLRSSARTSPRRAAGSAIE